MSGILDSRNLPLDAGQFFLYARDFERNQIWNYFFSILFSFALLLWHWFFPLPSFALLFFWDLTILFPWMMLKKARPWIFLILSLSFFPLSWAQPLRFFLYFLLGYHVFPFLQAYFLPVRLICGFNLLFLLVLCSHGLEFFGFSLSVFLLYPLVPVFLFWFSTVVAPRQFLYLEVEKHFLQVCDVYQDLCTQVNSLQQEFESCSLDKKTFKEAKMWVFGMKLLLLEASFLGRISDYRVRNVQIHGVGRDEEFLAQKKEFDTLTEQLRKEERRILGVIEKRILLLHNLICKKVLSQDWDSDTKRVEKEISQGILLFQEEVDFLADQKKAFFALES